MRFKCAATYGGWARVALIDAQPYNGSNYVGAVRKKQRALGLHGPGKRLTFTKGIDWQFIPPEPPHCGGIFGRMIKAAKRAVYAVLKEAGVDDEDLQTVFTGTESLLNSRILTADSGDVTDISTVGSQNRACVDPKPFPSWKYRWRARP